MTEVFKQLEELGFYKWLNEEHDLADENDLIPEYLNNTSITDIHRTVVNAWAFRWFREKYGLRNSIIDFIDDETGIEWDYEIAIIGTDLDEKGNYIPLVDYSKDDETRKFKTFSEAELACIIKLIELTKSGSLKA